MAATAVELEIDGQTVRVSSPEKPYFADLGLTKLDVVEYFRSVGGGILTALRDRPTAMERWPGGVRDDVVVATRADGKGEAFYQKRAPANTPDWVQTAEVTFPSGRTATEVAPADLATIVWMANLGTVRFHPWPVRAADTDAVDQLRIDLDPQPGVDFAMAVTAALELREVLAEAGLTGFCKTSGGRGVHVFAPIERCRLHRGPARRPSRSAGNWRAGCPTQVTVNWWKEERGERVFVDFNQMARDRLMTSAYSIRPTPRGLVSAPLDWDELPDVHPSDFTLLTMPERFAAVGDKWAAHGRPRAGLADARRWSGSTGTPPAARARCPTRRSTRRCRASRRGCSPARRTPPTGSDG